MGTYIVNPDCSGSGKYLNSDGDIVATWDFILEQKRNRFVWVWTTPGAVGTSYTIFTKTGELAEIPCSEQTLKGKYIYQPSMGWLKQGDSRVPEALIGQARYELSFSETHTRPTLMFVLVTFAGSMVTAARHSWLLLTTTVLLNELGLSMQHIMLMRIALGAPSLMVLAKQTISFFPTEAVIPIFGQLTRISSRRGSV